MHGWHKRFCLPATLVRLSCPCASCLVILSALVGQVDCRQFVGWKVALFYVLSVLTIGALPLVCRWKPVLPFTVQTSPSTLSAADVVVVVRKSKGRGVERLQMHVPVALGAEPLCMFEHRHTRYLYNTDTNVFERILDLSQGVTVAHIQQYATNPRLGSKHCFCLSCFVSYAHLLVQTALALVLPCALMCAAHAYTHIHTHTHTHSLSLSLSLSLLCSQPTARC